MPRVAVLLLPAIMVASCAGAPPKSIEFLTREGCVQTTTMRDRLDEALNDLTTDRPYTLVDLDRLPSTDVRKAYPTPTVLYGGVDLFGMAEPKPPFPEPT